MQPNDQQTQEPKPFGQAFGLFPKPTGEDGAKQQPANLFSGWPKPAGGDQQQNSTGLFGG